MHMPLNRAVAARRRKSIVVAAASVESLDRRAMLDGSVPPLDGPPNLDGGGITTGSIAGRVFVDFNGNTIRDAIDTDRTGLTVKLDAGNDGTIDATLTSSDDGSFKFDQLAPGQYRVTVDLPAGESLGSDLPAIVNIAGEGDIATLAFGIAPPPTQLVGFVYNDANGNGAKDDGELGVSDATAFIDANGNEKLDADELSSATNVGAPGSYAFTLPSDATSYTIRIIAPVGFVQTTPLLSPVLVTPGTVNNAPDVGVKLIPKGGTLTGTVFNDINGNGTQDAGELGVEGVTVYTDQNETNAFEPNVEVSTVTDSNGTYHFDFSEDDEYLLKLILPANWTQTTPSPANVIVALGWDVSGPSIGVRFAPPPPPVVTIDDASIAEGNSGFTALAFKVTRTGDLSSPSSLAFRLLSGGAVPTSDYVGDPGGFLIPGSVSFAAGQSEANVVVQIRGDTQVETNETFFVELSKPVNATIGRAKAKGTIINDDTVAAGGSVTVVTDPTDATKTALRVEGTVGADVIAVNYGGAQGKASVVINGVTKGTFNFTGIIWVLGNAGADKITIAPAHTRSSVVYAGDGADTVIGGAGNDIYVLGEGSDQLQAGGGRDIGIGQNGGDKLDGQSGDDLLLGGTSTIDESMPSLWAIMKEWSRADRTYAERIAAIQTGTGGANGSVKLNNRNAISGATPPDTLIGGSGQDFFFANLRASPSARDVITDKASNETVVLL
jgi:Ca2+-binding RTX toxin-like protein